MSKVFKDLGKDSKDLLSQDFVSGSNLLLSYNTKTPNDIGFKGSDKRTTKTDTKKVTKEVVEALVDTKVEWKSQNIEFNLKLSTSRDFSVGFFAKDMATKGSKIDFQYTVNEKDGTVAKLSPSYKSDSFSAQTSVAYPLSLGKKIGPPIKWISELVFQFPRKLFWGLNFLFDFEHNQTKIKTEGVVVNHLTENSAFAGRAAYNHQDESLVWGFSYFQDLSHSTKWSADYEFDTSKGLPIVQIGGQYKVDHNTTLKSRAVVKSTELSAPTDYRLGLSLKQQVSKNLKATLGADFNVRQILGEGVGEAHSFGCEVEISHD